MPSSCFSRRIGTVSIGRGEFAVRGSTAITASPSRPRPAGTTIGRSVRDPRAVPIRACSVASPRSGSYSSRRPPRERVACTAVSSTAPISACWSWVAASVSP